MNNFDRAREMVDEYVAKHGTSTIMDRTQFINWVHERYENISVQKNNFYPTDISFNLYNAGLGDFPGRNLCLWWEEESDNFRLVGSNYKGTGPVIQYKGKTNERVVGQWDNGVFTWNQRFKQTNSTQNETTKKIEKMPLDIKKQKTICTKEQVNKSLQLYTKLLNTVREFENNVPKLNRHFTLDGHLVGSIGEVVASYHYNIELSNASQKTYDGFYTDPDTGEQTKVQIKITQQNTIVLHDIPEHLIALYLKKDGTVYEIYNGPGHIKYIEDRKPDKVNGNKHLSILQLMEENKTAIPKIKPYEQLDLMTKDKRNEK